MSLVDTLRAEAGDDDGVGNWPAGLCDLLHDAANRIEALEAALRKPARVMGRGTAVCHVCGVDGSHGPSCLLVEAGS